ncbi:MAG: N-acetylneuraminate lyase [Shewanella sp.]|uniref:N-acetylneuraminate lyase n=1 Tax=Aeromonas rivipollensis TaxID=948519 RepID=A0AAW9YDX1_9GAMM|nr:N-acetylneuraminate lyase [Aeromonas rivipollensis]NEX75849.1 N-acetylneuraminate lyase [Aeromonas rivipollensis]
MNVDLRGLYAATLTPFMADETISFEDLASLIEYNNTSALDGLYVGGSTAEAFLCSTEERVDLLRMVAELASERLTLIAHVGDISTRKSETIARAAGDLPYQAISAVTPFYYPVGFQELKRHYSDLIHAAGKPMVVYNFPAFSGSNLSTAQIAELLEIDGVIALKQTSANLYQMEQITRAKPEHVVFNGFDEILASGLVAGAQGGIGSTYNIQADRIAAINTAIRCGDVEKAQRLQREANVVIDALVEAGVIPGLKYVLKAKGVLKSDVCRRPINAISSKNKSKLDALLEAGLC